MISGSFAILIREKGNRIQFLLFIFIISFIGIIIQLFEPYEGFEVLFPLLIIMFASVVFILHYCLKALQKFKLDYEENSAIGDSCGSLFPEKNNSVLIVSYLMIIAIYFLCLYNLKFVKVNLMGIYILFFGGGTFFIALSCYEINVRLTIALKNLAENLVQIEYNTIYPTKTSWLQHLFHLYHVLRNAAIGTSILFVFENSMLFYFNFNSNNWRNFEEIPHSLKNFPLEGWIIWLFILISIVIVLPLISQSQNRSFKYVIQFIETKFCEEITKDMQPKELYVNPQKFTFLLNTIQLVNSSLEKTYLLRKIDRLIAIYASILTCFAHLISFYTVFK